VKLKKILVTTDFSEKSRLAFPAAADLARKFGSELHLVHSMERIPAEVFFTSEGVQAYSPAIDYPLKFRDLLQQIAAEEPSFQGLSVKTHLLEGGGVTDRLLHFEKEHRIDLTVIASAGSNSFGHLLLGGFAEKVVRTSLSPVLACRARPGAGASGFSPKKMLVPYDFSENSRIILDFVRFLADAYQSQVRFQHVLEPLPDLALIPWEGITVDEIRERRTDAPSRGKGELEELIRKEFPGKAGFDAIADFGTPFVDIVRAARDFEADLILMTTHGWTGIRHMLLGSVTEKVVRKAPCSVLTVRPAGLSYEHP
jgi:nucleotide-binding universal stress UspA family protein